MLPLTVNTSYSIFVSHWLSAQFVICRRLPLTWLVCARFPRDLSCVQLNAGQLRKHISKQLPLSSNYPTLYVCNLKMSQTLRIQTSGHNKSEGSSTSDWTGTVRHMPSQCACGKCFTMEHAFSCSYGDFPSVQHNDIRDTTACLLSEVCHKVTLEPSLMPFTLRGKALA